VQPTLAATRNLLILATVLVALRLLFGLQPVEELLQKAVSPISGAVERLSFAGATEVDQELNNQALAEGLAQKNDELRAQLVLAQDFVVAEVIARDITGFRKSYVINKGSNDGLQVGQAVTSQDFLVGKILRLTPNTATVELVTDPEFKVTAATRDGEGGVVKSDSGSLVFDLVPSTDLSGQQVQTDGVDGQVAPGIIIGTLGQRISSDNRTFHAYHLILPLQLGQVQMVNIQRLPQE